MRRLLCLAVLLVTGVAVAADFHDGLAAFKQGDYGAAVAEWEPLARQGDAEAQYYLGRVYADGDGDRPDLALAVRWYTAAADRGHARAQNNLGSLYATGRGVPKDEAKAFFWYRKAAEQGRAVAQNNLAAMYEDGRGVEADFDRAFAWYREAAERGHLGAQMRVAEIYDAGSGVAADPARAFRWWKRAAEQEDAGAQNRLALRFDLGRGVKRDPGKALKWYRRAAEQEHPAAQRNLASIYAQGDGVRQDLEAARLWLERAGDATVEADDLRDGTARNGKLTSPGGQPAGTSPSPPVVVPETSREAPVAPKVERPAAPRSPAAAESSPASGPDDLYRMGQMYATGRGVKRDGGLAEKWYRQAAEQGHEMAAYKLAFLYFRGHGASGKKDFARAHFWLSLLAERDFGDAAWWIEKLASKMSDAELAESARLREAHAAAH